MDHVSVVDVRTRQAAGALASALIIQLNILTAPKVVILIVALRMVKPSLVQPFVLQVALIHTIHIQTVLAIMYHIITMVTLR